MTPPERRGKRLFLILAILIILDKLSGLGFAFVGGFAEFNLLTSVVRPVGFAIAVGFLWQGAVWLRWLVGVACVFSGGLLTFSSVWALVKLAGKTPPETTGFFMQVAGYPLGLAGVFGLLYVLAGLLFLFSPSVRSFFRYQRERTTATQS